MADVVDGTIVDGRYRILGRIGSGGMAEVYAAEDANLGRQVALKMLHRRFARDEEFVERFRREASAAAGLNHPHVVSVFDRGEHDGTYYIAMERLRGRTLKQLVKDEAPLDQLRAIDMTMQILQAAGFAHSRGIVHRDLKPHNVILDEGGRAKVTDFGIARAGASEMTETGSIMGTAQYLSPEQAQGHGVSAQSDLYSVGVTLYEMLTGRVPFDGDSAVSVAIKHLNQEPPPLRSIRPELHPLLEAAVMRALVKDPAGRYASAEEFNAALQEARAAIVPGGDGGGNTAVFAPVVVEEPWVEEVEPRRRPLWPVLLAVLSLALIAAGTFLLLQPEERAVPSVMGETVEDATARLTQAGFTVERRDAESDAPAGRVVAQDPAAGEEVDEGSRVTITVSSGPGERTVPTVRGFSQQRAVRALSRAGFRVDTEPQSDAEIKEGFAIRTDPRAGARVEPGEPITLFVSTGAEQVSVPDVVGSSEDTAEARLQGLGLLVASERRESEEPEGEVIAQSPDPGANVEAGSRVTLTVSSGQPEPETATVADVTGETRDGAVSTLRAAGFRVEVRQRETADEEEDGVVVDQRPAGGELERGRTVVIFVGRLEEEPPPEEPITGDEEAPPGEAPP